jgi:hypothetical protein
MNAKTPAQEEFTTGKPHKSQLPVYHTQ